MQHQRPPAEPKPAATVDWRDSAAGPIPVSRQFDDPYYSLDDGLAETRHVFLQGNDLPARFGTPLHIAELGFGTGLNSLVAWAAWQDAGARGPLHFTSFEAFPMTQPDMAAALAGFPALAPLAEVLLARWRPGAEAGLAVAADVTLTVILGDARQTLPPWEGKADAWFLDGFSPAKNPQMWQPDLLGQVAAHTVPGGTAASYTAAGHVRRALTEAGFAVARVPGFGRKRHMIRAMLTQATAA
jgi:tRNA U34 5-methylaminomethyl-2-thiouridine-forming methyltransferase MnmC